MRPDDSFIGQPVRSLQTMLRTIAQHQKTPTSIIPDGYYGTQTMSAVSAFQKVSGLPVTGVTDQATWERIVSAYEPLNLCCSPSELMDLNFDPGQIIRRGTWDANLLAVQSVLIVLSRAYSSITEPEITGVLDIPTAAALSDFQQLSGLPVTGELDRITWFHLARHYPMAARLLAQE